MANWASVSYALEGDPLTLQRIYKAIKDTKKNEESQRWEPDVMQTLFPGWDKTKGYLRGGILEDSWRFDRHGTLRFSAEEAWGATDFHKLLEDSFPGLKVYYSVEEQTEEVFFTNDVKGKYFPERFWCDTCIDGEYQSDYFVTEASMYAWLSKLTQGRITDAEDVENFIHIFPITAQETV